MERETTERSNEAQIRYWNDQAGPRWVRLQERLDAQLEPLGRAALAAAGVGRDATVLDVGCGCGALSLEAAARVGPGGSVLGVDISAPMLARARERSLAAGTASVEFLEADAETHAFAPGAFDAVVSRFGVMFFASPERAFANLRRALRPGGRLAFVCWQTLGRNVWMSSVLAAVARHLPLPPPPAPGAPGPFAFADPERVRSIVLAGGFETPRIEPLEGALALGAARTPEEAAEFVLEIGPAGQVLREAGADAALRRKVAASVAEALAPFAGADGVAAPYAAWQVSAEVDARP